MDNYDDPTFRNLSDTETKDAVKEQILTYPRVSRGPSDPSITGQAIGNISFHFFKQPRTLSNGSNVYGFFKLRGNHPDSSSAVREATKLIREVDSKFKIRQVPVGGWYPLTPDDAFVKDMIDIHENKDEDEVIKQNEEERKRIKRELAEREQELKASGDIYDDPESVKYYSMRRVTELRLQEAIVAEHKKIDNLKETLGKVRSELHSLDDKYSTYKDEWVEVYNIERRKAGIPDFIPSSKQIEQYENNN